MVKFILLIQLCYAGGLCYPPMSAERWVFNDYKSCIMTGYKESMVMMNEMSNEEIMTKRPVLRFWCKEEKEDVKKETST